MLIKSWQRKSDIYIDIYDETILLTHYAEICIFVTHLLRFNCQTNTNLTLVTHRTPKHNIVSTETNY